MNSRPIKSSIVPGVNSLKVSSKENFLCPICGGEEYEELIGSYECKKCSATFKNIEKATKVALKNKKSRSSSLFLRKCIMAFLCQMESYFKCI